jgi:hypothetical protein
MLKAATVTNWIGISPFDSFRAVQVPVSQRRYAYGAGKVRGFELTSLTMAMQKCVKPLQSLGAALETVLTPTCRQDHLSEVRFLRQSATFELRFEDGFSAQLPVAKLGMPVNRVRWETAVVSPSGEKLHLTGIRGDAIPIDTTTLRYLVDSNYAEEVNKTLKSVRLSRNELRELARDNPPPLEFLERTGQDLTRASWK